VVGSSGVAGDLKWTPGLGDGVGGACGGAGDRVGSEKGDPGEVLVATSGGAAGAPGAGGGGGA